MRIILQRLYFEGARGAWQIAQAPNKVRTRENSICQSSFVGHDFFLEHLITLFSEIFFYELLFFLFMQFLAI